MLFLTTLPLRAVLRKVEKLNSSARCVRKASLSLMQVSDGRADLGRYIALERHVDVSQHFVAVKHLKPQGHGHGILVAEKTSRCCFIAWQGRDKIVALNANHYLEKIVSPEVDLVNAEGSSKQAQVRKWINKMLLRHH